MRHELVELTHRLVFRHRQYVLVVFGREVRLDAMDAAEVNFTASDHGEQDGETACGACRTDALARSRLRHVIPPHQKLEQRGKPLPGPQPPSIDDADVAKEARDMPVILPYQLAKLVEERLIAQLLRLSLRRLGWMRRSHAHLYHGLFRPSRPPKRRWAFELPIARPGRPRGAVLEKIRQKPRQDRRHRPHESLTGTKNASSKKSPLILFV